MVPPARYRHPMKKLLPPRTSVRAMAPARLAAVTGGVGDPSSSPEDGDDDADDSAGVARKLPGKRKPPTIILRRG